MFFSIPLYAALEPRMAWNMKGQRTDDFSLAMLRLLDNMPLRNQESNAIRYGFQVIHKLEQLYAVPGQAAMSTCVGRPLLSAPHQVGHLGHRKGPYLSVRACQARPDNPGVEH